MKKSSRSIFLELIDGVDSMRKHREETDSVFKSLVKDTGQPSAALRAYRKRADLTQRELALKSDIPQPHIAAVESGKRPIGLIAAKKLALALGVHYRKLV